MELTLNYGHYNSILSEGNRVRRMRRTELSYDKICFINSPKVSRPTSRDSMLRSPQKIKRATSMPKLQSLYRARPGLLGSGLVNENNLVQNEYYKADPRPETVETEKKSLAQSPYISVQDLENNSHLSNNSKSNSKVHRKSKPSLLVPKSHLSNKSQSSNQASLRPSSKSKSKNSKMFGESMLSKQSFVSSKKEQSKVAAPTKKSHINQNVDYYGIRNSRCSERQQAQSSHQSSQENFDNSSIGSSQNQNIPIKSENSAFLRKKPSKVSKISASQGNKSISRHSEYLNNESKISQKRDKISGKESGLEKNLSSSEYMLKSSMLNSEMDHSQYFQKSKRSKKFSKANSSKLADPILQSSALKEQNWKQTIKSINIEEKVSSSIMKKKSINLGKEKNAERNLSLKIDSVRNDAVFKAETSTKDTRQKQSTKSISVRKSSKLLSEASQEPPCENSIEDVLERINLYDTILEEIKDFSETMKTFDSTLQDEDTQILCFLLNKKYLYEKSNLLKCLKGMGNNVLALSSVEVPTEILNQYLKHPEVLQYIQQLQNTAKTFYKQFSEDAKRVKSLTKGNPLIDTLTPNDKFTNQLVNRLWEQIDSVYGEMSSLSETNISQAEDLVIQMMELIFLFSSMRGRRVKRIEFADFIEDFEEYFDKNMPKLESTLQYFRATTP